MERTAEKFDLAVFTGGGSLFVLWFFANYNVIDNSQMIIPALVLTTLPVAFGLSSVLSKASSTFNNLSSLHLLSMGGILLLFFIFVNRPLVDRLLLPNGRPGGPGWRLPVLRLLWA